MQQQWPLYQRIAKTLDSPQGESESGKTLDQFLDYISEMNLSLYPAQEEALLELYSGKNVILKTPTGSGKSLVAQGVHFLALSQGRRSIYTCPIKALVNEKFLALCRDFGPDQVGMITGDATVNPSAKILCCTAEILANDALRLGAKAEIHDVIMDEFHYYSDKDRGVAWQIPLLTLPQTRFLLMSATLGDCSFFEKTLTELNGRDTVTVYSTDRPVPLDFQYSELPLHETVGRLVSQNQTPIYLVSFTQRGCSEEAQNFMSIDVCTKEEKRQIAEMVEEFKFTSPYGKDLKKFIKHGLGIHHAGLLPKYRVLVEKLAQKGLLKIIFGTDTLGVGVNVPIRTVLFTKLCKFDGEKTTILSVRDFQQISGRAGRKGFDNQGLVVVQAPEHIIDNLRNEQKAAGDPKKLRKLVKKKPPEKGFLPWNKQTFEKLVQGQPEALVSRFKVSHAMILQVLERTEEDGCRALQKIIRKSHESPHARRQHGKKAFQLFRSLVDRKIIELNPMRINVDLQEDFSLNHALALYLIDTLKLLQPESETYALDVLSLVESILENPDLILRKQLDRIKTEKMAEMKMSGMEYDERMEELEKLEYPKPNRDFIYMTFNDFSASHPWVGQDNIRPKSVAREMYENYHSFADYIREYDLHRGEGILLRYLFDVYKAVVQTVPAYAKTEELDQIEVYLGHMVRDVDSSLLDEWERMRDPSWKSAGDTESPIAEARREGPKDVFAEPSKHRREFQVLVRNEVFRFVRALASQNYEDAFHLLARPEMGNNVPWTVERLEAVMKEYYESDTSELGPEEDFETPRYKKILLNNEARSSKYQHWDPNWAGLQQVLVDSLGCNDWMIVFGIDLQASRAAGKPILDLLGIKPVG